MKLRAFRGLAVGSLALIAGCASGDNKEINQALDQELFAVTQGDAAAFFSAFSSGYQDEFFPLDQARPTIADRLQSPGKLSARRLRRSIEQQGDQALATEEFYLEGVIAEQPRRFQEVQHVRLKRTPAGWKIAAGSKLYQLLAGRVEEEDRIVRALDQRVQALESRDLSRYMAVVSPHYQDQGRGPEAVRAKVQDIFESFDQIRYRVLDRKLRWDGNQAVVEQGFRLEAELMGEHQTLEDRERLELLREDGQWKITGGL